MTKSQKHLIRIVVLLIIMNLFPVSYSITRLTSLIIWPIVILLTPWLLWKKKIAITVNLSCIALATLAISFPRTMKMEELQTTYLQELRSFEGCFYVWGGENFIGIDCSGLARKALINSLLKEGQFKEALDLWYYDSSAKALRDNYRKLTVNVSSEKSINEINYSSLRAGDLAITSNGVHVLIYLGEQEWIEADPGELEVLIVKAPQENFEWFNSPVEIRRWSLLEEGSLHKESF